LNINCLPFGKLFFYQFYGILNWLKMEPEFCSQNPYTLELYQKYDFESLSSLEQKLENAAKSFENWRLKSIQERAPYFTNLAKLLKERALEYGKIITLEMGKPITQSIAEINKSAWLCEYYIQHAEEYLKSEDVFFENKLRGRVQYEPLGTILQIMPWNFPFWQVFRCTVPTLLAGNTTLLKHATNVPQCALLIEQVFKDAGFPETIFQSIFASVNELKYLIEKPEIKGVALTGSVKAGISVAVNAAANLKPVVLELGGSDPFIVWRDADLETAVQAAVNSRFGNNGQTCIAAKRFIIHKEIAPEFLEKLKKEIQSLPQGDPVTENSRLSVLARNDLARELQKQVDKSVELGAKIELHGGMPDEKLNIFKPVILSSVKKGMPAYDEELFGPVLSFFVVENEVEAVKLANDTIFGLAASVWTKDNEIAERLIRNLNVGNVALNQIMQSVPYLPFGGHKKSGLGRELGAEGIKAFVNKKSVLL
jgi:succinate-semialdehyde dehydrogenase/glutarate-semialdehyde dehydrogenase